MIAPKIDPSRFEKEHPPLVVVGDVGLVWRYALKGGEILITLQYLLDFGLDHRKVGLKLLGYWEIVGIKVLLIPQQAVLMEGLFKQPLNPHSTYLQLHHALRSAFFIRA